MKFKKVFFGTRHTRQIISSFSNNNEKNLTPTQKNYLFQGLLVALQNATPRSLIVVFTDNGSKDLDLEKEIIRPVTNYKKNV